MKLKYILGELLKKKRSSNTQEIFAKAHNILRTQLAQYETGSALLSYEKLQELQCKFFKQDRQAAEKQIKEHIDELDIVSFTELYNTFYRLNPNTNFKRRLKEDETTV